MTFLVAGGVGGGIEKVNQAPDEGAMVHVEVKDIEATLDKAVKLGAKVVTSVTEIGNNRCHRALFKNPGGCTGVGFWSKR